MDDFEDDEILWHPKVTPYRLIVLSTTIGLGTAKAILAQEGSAQYVSTTFEWIGGTVIFLILFMINPYDSGAPSPRYLSWLFEPDCMDVIWFLLAHLSIQCPNYESEERIPDPDSDHLPITIYRVLVCSLVVAFGISKAAFGYLGSSTAVTWIDWMLGVVATSIFYCLGLYESSTENIWPSFFSYDRRQNIYSFGVGTLSAAGIALSVMWTLYWKRFVGHAWRDPKFAYIEPGFDHPTIDKAFNKVLICFLLEMMILFIAVGAISVLSLLRLLAISLLSKAGIFHAGSRQISRPLLPLLSGDDPFPSPDFPPDGFIGRVKTFVLLCVHIALYACFLTGWLLITFIVTGLMVSVPDFFRHADNLVSRFIFFFMAIQITFITIVAWFSNLLILMLMIRPLFLYRDGDSTQLRSSLIIS
ncbi:hypothetical protein GALMADRAFT_253721 [Galerina marginata CBS 339.88]|uniref:Uncharacterized protein n=1 Tax=Galerina marginata (strain CBS 339.88) TaxID=685588 RepID=A0A067SPJ9_GALM3|nr:hypothetical protein GALMADRAFT_253721 [Galerina marginata CBS 339.88]